MIKKITLTTLFALPLAVMPANAAISTGLVEYWKFDGNYTAEVDTGHNGTLVVTGTGSAAFATGKFGQGIDLAPSTGNAAYVEVGGTESDFDFADQSMSFSLWYRTDSTYVNWQTLIGKGENNNWRAGRFGGNSSLVRLVPGSQAANGLVLGQWYHIAGVIDYNSTLDEMYASLYIDGVATGGSPETVSGGLAGSAQQMMIGNNPGATERSWDGMIDDVAVWNRALTAQEVADIYNGGSGASIASLIPEPSTALLGGLGALLLLRRRRS